MMILSVVLLENKYYTVQNDCFYDWHLCIIRADVEFIYVNNC